MRLPRWVLAATSFTVLVAASVGVAAVVSGGDASVPRPPSVVPGPQRDARVPTDAELTSNAAVGAKQASLQLAAELATPQTIADESFVVQSMADLKR